MPEPHYRYLDLKKKSFPHADNVDVYKYTNDFDYSRYDYSQMQVQVCSVNWDQGEAHIGNRTLEGIGNVVWFGSEEKRDAWFDAIPDDECFRWETKFKELHTDYTLMVPIPFDVAAQYNYVRVKYNLFANDGSPVEYENKDGVREWFYFVREAHFIAPNATELILLDDAWQTWMYRVDVKSMILERGHAPLFATSVDKYLSNPLGNNSNLLAKDVNFGELQQVTRSQATILNGSDVVACFVTTANPAGSWGTKANADWRTPAAGHYDVGGVPSFATFEVETSELNAFLDNVTSTSPQFKQSVQAVFFVSAKFLTIGSAFTFCGVSCHWVSGSNPVSLDVMTPKKSDWGYDDRYSGIAKLYTSPYSAYEVTDEKGSVELVRIEDTTGRLSMDVVASLAFPYLNISGTIRGIGGKDSTSLSFKNISQHSFSIGGRWYQHLRQWDIPTFAVVLDASREYDYSSDFDRRQMDNDRSTQQTIANRSAANTKSNADSQATTESSNTQNIANAGYEASVARADASLSATTTTANAQQTCEDNSADNVVDNATAQTTANTTINSNSNATASSDASLTNALAQAIQAWDAGMTRATANNEIDMKNATTAVGAAGGTISAAANGAISGYLTAGPAGAGAGALGGLISGGINAATSLATNAIAVSATSSQAEAVVSNSQSKLGETQRNNTDRTNNANSGKTANTSAQNTAITTTANNSASTTKENAKTSRDASVSAAGTIRYAAVSAADTTRDAEVAAAQASERTTKAVNASNLTTANQNAADTYTNAGKRIDNLIKQAGLRSPFTYGSMNNASTATTRPMALFVNVVTESDYAIKLAGDEFLRYGYYYDRQWDFDGNWNVGKHFTFWKLRDYWTSSQIPDRYADQLRFFLYGGVTVWRDPEDIGQVTIYDNGI